MAHLNASARLDAAVGKVGEQVAADRAPKDEVERLVAEHFPCQEEGWTLLLFLLLLALGDAVGEVSHGRA